MVLRIEKRSIVITPTADQNVVLVDADVTKDDITVANPTMHHVSVLWNTTTPRSVLKEAMKAALKDETFQNSLREAIGEIVIPEPTSEPAPTTVVINATSVTVNQTGA